LKRYAPAATLLAIAQNFHLDFAKGSMKAIERGASRGMRTRQMKVDLIRAPSKVKNNLFNLAILANNPRL
jgi:hypothetical protein